MEKPYNNFHGGAESMPTPPNDSKEHFVASEELLKEVRRNAKFIKMLRRRIKRKDKMLEDLISKAIPPELKNDLIVHK